ncbi:MAG TPA: CoA pyrophosphatase [Burkholderiaceae bacterium]|nr:CoA pyrophosphatase [Burkholderiaceae bacterium]
MPLGFDPQELPIVGIDDHLPALTAQVLRSAAVRQRFLMPPVWTPEIKAEPRFGERGPTHASVLVALVEREELTVLLTQRTDHLSDHPGQVSFAGGRVEPTDADAAATALREAHEEIGLEASFVDVLGAMPTYTTGTGFIVTPIVALVRPGFTVAADPFEVADVFEVPLDFILDRANHQRHFRMLGTARRDYWAIPWLHRYIWGATAAMLLILERTLRAD